MAELDVIIETLKRQRLDLDEEKRSTSLRSGETAELVGKLEDLRRRSEATLRRFQSTIPGSESEKRK